MLRRCGLGRELGPRVFRDTAPHLEAGSVPGFSKWRCTDCPRASRAPAAWLLFPSQVPKALPDMRRLCQGTRFVQQGRAFK
ncbi:hypothetical protein NN561_015874 [Cricetulus griseus]